MRGAGAGLSGGLGAAAAAAGAACVVWRGADRVGQHGSIGREVL